MTAEELFRGRLIMAPMTRGTDLPFRRLAAEWGAEVSVSEMAYAHAVVKGDRRELALLRRHPAERHFGVQLAGKRPEVVAEAARIAEAAGADFVDLNLGCPIDDATRRGFGAALLRKPVRVAEIVAAVKRAVSVPVSIKLRTGWSSEKPTFVKVARAAEAAGADAITLHARSRAQRYRRPADWSLIRELNEAVAVPVIGNGDVMSGADARRRLAEGACAGVMIGRWGLAKPWVFREFALSSVLDLDPEARLGVVRRYVELCFEHFGDDDRGRARVRRFLGFHQDFFRRYRRGASPAGANADDPREWGEQPRDELESWLCRADVAAVEALADWLVDGRPCRPPGPPPEDAPRAVKTPAYG
jgi:tRNA-dihydrouridine synthase 3